MQAVMLIRYYNLYIALNLRGLADGTRSLTLCLLSVHLLGFICQCIFSTLIFIFLC